jgi:hypothetical protein
MAKIVTKLTMAVVCLPFRYVAWHPYGCTAHLVGEAVNFTLGKGLGRIVKGTNQVHRLLPCDEMFEVLRDCTSAYN